MPITPSTPSTPLFIIFTLPAAAPLEVSVAVAALFDVPKIWLDVLPGVEDVLVWLVVGIVERVFEELVVWEVVGLVVEVVVEWIVEWVVE